MLLINKLCQIIRRSPIPGIFLASSSLNWIAKEMDAMLVTPKKLKEIVASFDEANSFYLSLSMNILCFHLEVPVNCFRSVDNDTQE